VTEVRGLTGGTIAIWAVVAGIVILGAGFGWFISVRNRFERLAVKISESDAGIDVALTKRYDMLTKMLDVTKGYAKHESEVLGGIVKLRQGMSMAEKGQANTQMNDLTGRLNLLVENYPDLKASENFRQLQISVTEVEDHLQAARRVYHLNVSAFNQLLVSWPASIVGGYYRHGMKEFFEAEDMKRQDVQMAFS
jgi:LemA protein